MKLASTLLLVLNFGASTASNKQLRGGGEEYARRLTLADTTDTPTVSSAPSTSPAPSTSEPTSVPTVAPEPTFNPTIEPCSADNLVPIGYYDDYDWIELPECVQEAAEMFGYDQNSWDKGKERCPDWCDEWWEDLTEEQQWAASVFGYNEELWNSEEYKPPVNATANTTAPRTSPATSTSEPTSEPTANPTIEPCSADNLVPIGYYDDYDWIELPECVQEAAEMFGYDQNSWDKGKERCPDWCDEWWEDLTEEQQWAASVFGYNEELWNSEE